MPISRTNIDNLIFSLKQTPVAFLIDQEQEILMVDEGYLVDFQHISWAQIKFDIEPIQIKELFQTYSNEQIINRLTNDFNIDFYFTDAKASLTDLIKKFTLEKIGELDVKIRKDLIVKYYSQDEDEFVEEINDEGNVFQNIRPKVIVLTPDKYANIPFRTLEKISAYFSYQEKLIKRMLVNITNECKSFKTNPYGTKYQYKYFMFDYAKIGNGDNPEEYINSFIWELIEKKYIPQASQKLLFDYFHNIPSPTKVRWLGFKQDLSYIITQLIKKGYIVDPKRHRPYSIAYVFTDKNGLEFSHIDFDGVQLPTNTAPLDTIIGILG